MVNLGGLLSKLESEIGNHLRNSGKVSDYQVKVAFHNFVQIRFKIGENRAKEYIRLGQRKDLHGFNLPASVLIELSRLDLESLKIFLKKHPVANLKNIPFKEIKKLVRANNENKRESTSESNDNNENPSLIVSKLRNTFEQVKVHFESEPTLDKGLDSVLGQISKWYLDKKVA